ncbi:xanthine dehydrogenase family protein molybdopterin-binding subunit [Pleomorphovibrio marinus]|uniref:xanthine dehydrogenase family protein molybdopterin-binding subunit n=1 Tax=Pleomorphovibrio marinus TaxID=2164132 RepID=UPI000E0B3E0D|nr:molybdopterin cofactor-binding domain-containing protein [Pleomorphovibrio marinus]
MNNRQHIPFINKAINKDRSTLFKPSRREFLKLGSLATGGLLIGINLKCSGPSKDTETFAPNVYLSIGKDNTVTIVAHRSEMGTGIRTTLPMVLADELGADWKNVKIEQAVGDEEKYGDQNTDGSYSIRMFYDPMRKAGATARHMLLKAASKQWDVKVEECETKDGAVIHSSSGNQATFGELVEEASKLDLPSEGEIKFKPFAEYKLIGKDIPIYDLKAIVMGKATFGADVSLPDMLVAVIGRSPVVGASIKGFDKSKAMEIPGVKEVLQIDGSEGVAPGLDKPLPGVAVLATNTWAAIKGRDALEIDWDLGENQQFDSDGQLTEMLESTRGEGKTRRERGNFAPVNLMQGNSLDKTYLAPFYAHGTIEPPAAIANYADGKLELWAPTQHPQWAREAAATALDLPIENVKVNVTLLGGGFGRKSKPDFVVEAALLSKAMGKPVRVQWTREDDLHHDFYHSHSAQRIQASLDGSGKIYSWNHHTVFPAIGATSNPDELHPSDGEMGLGALDFPYDIPHIRLESHESKAHTRIGWLRSVSNIHHAFAICCMLDEMAEKRGIDPIAQVLELLGDDQTLSFEEEVSGDFGNYGEPYDKFPWETGRMKNVVRKVAEASGWQNAKREGKYIGFAAHKSFLTYVACTVTVEKDSKGNLIIPEVHYAVDCGIAVNTDRVRSQFEGGAQFALSLATSAITFKDGKVQENNFSEYKIIRMPQAPKKTHVHIIESQEKPTGVGEPPVPPFIPALCNALYQMTGKRIYELPIKV